MFYWLYCLSLYFTTSYSNLVIINSQLSAQVAAAAASKRTSRAAVCTEIGKPLEIQLIESNDALENGQVHVVWCLVKSKIDLLNGVLLISYCIVGESCTEVCWNKFCRNTGGSRQISRAAICTFYTW